MAHSHSTVFYAVKDVQIKAITADPRGGTTTLGSLIPIDSPKTLALTPGFKSDALRGGMQLRDFRSVMTDLKWTLTFGGLNLDAETAIFGGAVTDTGTTPNQVTTWTQNGDDPLKFFQLEAQCTAVDDVAGDAHIVLYKCMADAESLGYADETHHVFSLSGQATPRLSDKKWRSIILNETLAAIA